MSIAFLLVLAFIFLGTAGLIVYLMTKASKSLESLGTWQRLGRLVVATLLTLFHLFLGFVYLSNWVSRL